jgi:hypothetical protein
MNVFVFMNNFLLVKTIKVIYKKYSQPIKDSIFVCISFGSLKIVHRSFGTPSNAFLYRS